MTFEEEGVEIYNKQESHHGGEMWRHTQKEKNEGRNALLVGHPLRREQYKQYPHMRFLLHAFVKDYPCLCASFVSFPAEGRAVSRRKRTYLRCLCNTKDLGVKANSSAALCKEVNRERKRERGGTKER